MGAPVRQVEYSIQEVYSIVYTSKFMCKMIDVYQRIHDYLAVMFVVGDKREVSTRPG